MAMGCRGMGKMDLTCPWVGLHPSLVWLLPLSSVPHLLPIQAQNIHILEFSCYKTQGQKENQLFPLLMVVLCAQGLFRKAQLQYRM